MIRDVLYLLDVDTRLDCGWKSLPPSGTDPELLRSAVLSSVAALESFSGLYG